MGDLNLMTPKHSFQDHVGALQQLLDRRIPEAVLSLFKPGSSAAARLLPFANDRERDPPKTDQSDALRFLDAQARLDSVLGHAISNAELSAADHNHIWPNGLLVVYDAGCAIYFAIDLDSPSLRVIEYEHLEPTDNPSGDANKRALAYTEPIVPRSVQHRFIVAAESLEQWLSDQFGIQL